MLTSLVGNCSGHICRRNLAPPRKQWLKKLKPYSIRNCWGFKSKFTEMEIEQDDGILVSSWSCRAPPYGTTRIKEQFCILVYLQNCVKTIFCLWRELWSYFGPESPSLLLLCMLVCCMGNHCAKVYEGIKVFYNPTN